MKSFLKKTFFSLAVLGGFVYPSMVFSASLAEKPFKLAVLDVDHVIQGSDVTAYIQNTVDQRRADLQRDVEGYEKELRQKEITLKNLQNKNDPSFEKAKKEFENEVTDVQKRISGRSKILEKAFHDARSQVIQKVMALVSALAESESMTLVIPKNVVMYQEEGYDITERILARLNADMPTLKIDLP